MTKLPSLDIYRGFMIRHVSNPYKTVYRVIMLSSELIIRARVKPQTRRQEGAAFYNEYITTLLLQQIYYVRE